MLFIEYCRRDRIGKKCNTHGEMWNACRILIRELKKLISLKYLKRTLKTNIEFGVKGGLIARSVAIKHIGIWSNALVGTLKDPHSPHTRQELC